MNIDQMVGEITDQINNEMDRTKDNIEVECEDCSVSTPDSSLRAVIEHAAFEHFTRRGLVIIRRSRLLSGYELGESLELPTLTEHEDKWRTRRDEIQKLITTDTNH